MLVVLETTLTLEVAVHLVIDDALRNFNLCFFNQLGNELLASFARLNSNLALLCLCLEALCQLCNGVEFRSNLSEVIVSLGKLALLHSGNGDSNLCLLAFVVATEQVGLEGGGLTSGERFNSFIDTFDELARANLVGDGLSSVNLGATNGCNQIKLSEVTLLCWAVNGHEGAEAATQLVEFLLNVFLRHCCCFNLNGETVELRKLHLGTNVNLDGDNQVAREVLLGWPGGDVCFGATHGAHLLVENCLAVETFEALVHSVLEHSHATNALVNQRSWCLALTEAGNVERFSNVLVGVLDCWLQLICGHRDGELGASVAEFFDLSLHEGVLLLVMVMDLDVVGATGFEPATSRSQSGRSSQAELRPGPADSSSWKTTSQGRYSPRRNDRVPLYYV